MALNWTMLNPDRTPMPLPNEIAIMTVDSGADVSLTVPDTPPAASAISGGSGGERKLKGIGKLFLTDQRVRFVNCETRYSTDTHPMIVDLRLGE
jgi:hypothetical protein